MVKRNGRFRRWLAAKRRTWINAFLGAAGLVVLSFILAADGPSEIWFGLTMGLWTIGWVPLLGFSMVRPVLKSRFGERLLALIIKVLVGPFALLAPAIYGFFITSLFSAGWNVELGQDFISYAPYMAPSAIGQLLACTIIVKARGTAGEFRFFKLGSIGAGVLFFLQIIAIGFGAVAFFVATAGPQVLLAVAAFVTAIHRLYREAESDARARDDDGATDQTPEEEAWSKDPWQVLRRV